MAGKIYEKDHGDPWLRIYINGIFPKYRCTTALKRPG